MKFTNDINTILFDLDGTLRHNLPTGGEFFTDYVISLGMQITKDDRRRAAVWEHYYFAGSPEITADREKYNGEGEDFWFHFGHRRLVALGCPPALVPELGPKVTNYMRENYQPNASVSEDIHITLPILREARYTLGVVSNRDTPFQDEIDELGIGDYFHFSLAAGEVGSWKPEPGIFEHAVKIAGTTPEQTVYIGDNYFADIVGARRAGVRPVLYDTRGLFHDPGCPVITSFTELIELLKT